MIRIASIGECMIEIQDMADGSTRRTFGGDTLNVAVYARRALADSACQVSYVTAVGDDPFSDEMLRFIDAEQVDTSTALRLPGQLPGLYAITLNNGERQPWFWRSQAAARQLLKAPQFDTLAQRLSGYDALYFSGISLGILDDGCRQRLLALLGELRAAGKAVIFDTNYRPRLWHTAAQAQHWVNQALAVSSMALPTFEDEQALFGDASPAQTLSRIQAQGVDEVVVKCGAEPCHIARAGTVSTLAAAPVANVIDTTAAGDSFNGAYLAARLSGATPEHAAQAGHRMAAQVIQYRGAIVPTQPCTPATSATASV